MVPIHTGTKHCEYHVSHWDAGVNAFSDAIDISLVMQSGPIDPKQGAPRNYRLTIRSLLCLVGLLGISRMAKSQCLPILAGLVVFALLYSQFTYSSIRMFGAGSLMAGFQARPLMPVFRVTINGRFWVTTELAYGRAWQ
jgi:hypothetical protein